MRLFKGFPSPGGYHGTLRRYRKITFRNKPPETIQNQNPAHDQQQPMMTNSKIRLANFFFLNIFFNGEK